MELRLPARWNLLLLTAPIVVIAFGVGVGAAWSAQTRDTVTIRGHAQLLHVYGDRHGTPVIVSSGDGGWFHLGPQVAEFLAARGFFVVGFDVKAYLEGFTSGSTTLRADEVSEDYKVLVDYAAQGATDRPILIGVSEGAGLSVLAATAGPIRRSIAGVIGLGLSDLNELGWRWKDDVIYLTHETPNEPTFSAAAVVGRISPVPLALIHSTHDEFVPLAEAQNVFERAHEPKRFWIVKAANHRFSDNPGEFNRSLLESIAWIGSTARK